ncbi:LuxR C-terminal-related transcriptional regulator [Streptomyces sp. NPDC020719]|uniref:helix-turn-helix transcriptional regulator n=1 Tax=Streptomyces sp. NPDC020719 TaxID=3154896 RepID=UPI003409EBEF
MTSTSEPLIGREPECRQLGRVVRRFAAGTTQVVEITGEPGIGKTRLLAELGRLASARGHVVRTGQATAAGGGRPWELFGDVWGDGSPGDLRKRLEAAAPPGGLVFLLDGLQWADDVFLAALDDLLRRPPKPPVLFALAHRPRQAPPRLRGLLRSAVAGGLEVERVCPGPLGPGEATGLVGADRAAGMGRRLPALLRAGGGNPLYLKILAHADEHAYTHDDAHTDGDADVDSRTHPHAANGPAAAFEVEVAAELGRVSATARQVARAAAVVGEHFTSELVAATAGLPEIATLSAIDELAGEDLVRPAEAPRSFTFRHPLLRDAVYESALPGWRLAAHTAVAAALTSRQADAAACAFHVERTARPGDHDAVRILAEAAHLVRFRQPDSAVRWLNAALRLLPTDAVVQRARLQFRLARLLCALGRLRESRELLHTVLEVLPREPAARYAAAVAACALVERALGRRAEPRSLLVDALDEATARDADAAGVLEFALARDDLGEGRPADCAARAERALAAAERRGSRGPAATAHGLLSLTGVLTGAIGSAQAHSVSAARLVDGLLDGQLAGDLDSVLWLGWSEAMLGRPPVALGHLDRGIAVARRSGREFALTHLLTARAFAVHLSGRLHEAETAAAEALELAVRSGAEEARTGALAVSCRIAVVTGDLDAALRTGTAAMEHLPVAGSGAGVASGVGGWSGTSVARSLAEARLDAGDATACLAAVRAVGGVELTGADVWSRVDWCELFTRASLAAGRVDVAARWADRAMAAARPLALPGRLGLALLARAQVLACRHSESAFGASVAAYDALTEAGLVIDANRARLTAAAALTARGETRRAAAELATAHRTFTACGARTLARRASAERRRIAARPPRSEAPRPGDLALLTRREGEVAALVSEGLTNRQIAHRLQVTEKTVQMHLSNAFGKLGVTSRAALASAVVRAAYS